MLPLHTTSGDPIEVGATSAVYALNTPPSPSSRPFTLSNIKGFTGHQEAGAGTVQLLEAVQVLTQRCTTPLLHLRELNPYVAAPISRGRVAIGRSGLAPLQAVRKDAGMCFGVSSFGAQGTNAHAIVSAPGAVGTSSGSSGNAAVAVSGRVLELREGRLWVAPQAQCLLGRCLVGRRRGSTAGPRVAFQARLDSPLLAYLWDYSAANGGSTGAQQPYLSNSVLVSMAASAAAMLNSGSSVASTTLLLQDLVLALPQTLPQHAGTPGQAAFMLLLTISGQGALAIEADAQKLLQCHAGTAVAALTATTVQPEVSGAEAAAAALTAGMLTRPAGSLLVSAVFSDAIAAAVSLVMESEESDSAAAETAVASLAADGMDHSGYALHPALLECGLQAAMLAGEADSPSEDASALWLSAAKGVLLPPGATAISSAMAGGNRATSGAADGSRPWVAAEYVHGADGSTCNVHSLSLVLPGRQAPALQLLGATLAADAMAAAAAAAARATAAGAEAAAAAKVSGLVATNSPLLAMEEEERNMFLQAQIMSEVSGVLTVLQILP